MATTQITTIDSSLSWLQALLLGQLSVVIAAIAVALIGYSMLKGRMPIRRAARTILGCFILFGAATIAHGLMEAARPQGSFEVGDQTVATSPPAVPPETRYDPPVVNANPFDPYASTPEYRQGRN